MLKAVRSIGELELKLKGLEASLPKAIEITFDQDLYLNNLAGLIGLHKEYYKQRDQLDQLELTGPAIEYDKILLKHIHLRNFLLNYVEEDPSTVNLTME